VVAYKLSFRISFCVVLEPEEFFSPLVWELPTLVCVFSVALAPVVSLVGAFTMLLLLLGLEEFCSASVVAEVVFPPVCESQAVNPNMVAKAIIIVSFFILYRG
jgi:hypothetical protein